MPIIPEKYYTKDEVKELIDKAQTVNDLKEVLKLIIDAM